MLSLSNPVLAGHTLSINLEIKTMAWEWSHTPEAYEAARENLTNIPFHELCVIAAEWDADEVDGFNHELYTEKFKEYEASGRVSATILWNKIKKQRTCDNGGSNAWVCPYGCHTVPFDAIAD
jgi:hypothetical protein